MNKKIIFFSVFCFLLAMHLYGAWSCVVCFAEVVDKIIAVVNDQSITKSELDQALKPSIIELRKQVTNNAEFEQKLKIMHEEAIQRLIEDKLLLQEAKKFKVEVKNDEIEERVQQIMQKFPNKETFEKAITAQGYNLWELKKTYKEQIMTRKLVRAYVKQHTQTTPSQIAQFYNSHPEKFKLAEGINVSQILIKYKPDEDPSRTEKAVSQVMELLNTGVEFSAVAKKYSEGPNAQEGGGIGVVERGVMAKEIDSVIFDMKEGEISKPIKIASGFAIFKVNSIQKGQIKPLEEVKDEIEELLLDNNTKDVVDKWLTELKSKAFISIKE